MFDKFDNLTNKFSNLFIVKYFLMQLHNYQHHKVSRNKKILFTLLIKLMDFIEEMFINIDKKQN